ncbi:hypothetical protein GGF32_009888 [Allomyces javanicus]|nr:hypothetical protein GGF32_009888 [Allomyces javanicus]
MSTVHKLLLDLYPQLHMPRHTLWHFSLDCDLIARLKQLAVDVAVGFLEKLGRFTKVTAQQERKCRTDKSNAIYFDMAANPEPLAGFAKMNSRYAERRDRGILDASNGALAFFDLTLTLGRLLTGSVP